MHAYIALCLATGIRTEEARALRWEHIDFGDLDARPPVPATAAVWRSVRAHGDTKTEKSRRTLGLPKMAVDALPVQEATSGGTARAGTEWSDQDLVLCTRTGAALDAANTGGNSGRSARPRRSGSTGRHVSCVIHCVTDFQFGCPRRGDRADSRALEHKDHRGGIQARTAADLDDRRRSHGQAFHPARPNLRGERSSEPNGSPDPYSVRRIPPSIGGTTEIQKEIIRLCVAWRGATMAPRDRVDKPACDIQAAALVLCHRRLPSVGTVR